MNIGQYVSLKDSADYTEVFEAPVYAGKSEGVTAGYLGQITALNVAGIGDAHVFTKIVNKFNEVRYLDNKDSSKYDYSDTAPTGVTVPTVPPPTGNSAGTLDKILGVFTGLIGIFGKAKPATTPTEPNRTPTSKEETPEEPTAGNNSKKTLAEWFKKNFLVAIILIIVVPGGIIWAIVAFVSAGKRKKAIEAQKRNGSITTQA